MQTVHLTLTTRAAITGPIFGEYIPCANLGYALLRTCHLPLPVPAAPNSYQGRGQAKDEDV